MRTMNASNQATGSYFPSPGPSSQGYRDALRSSLNNQTFGTSSPSDRSLRRTRRDGDRSPHSVNSSAGTGDGIRLESRRLRASERISLTRSMDKPGPSRAGGVESESAVNLGMILGKSVYSLLVMFSGIVMGALVVTGSVDWIYSPSTGDSPLWSCPSSVQAIGSVSALEGSSCELRFSFSSYASFESSVASAFRPYNSIAAELQCYQAAVYTDCSSESLCQVRCVSREACGVSVGSGTCSGNGFVWGSRFFHGAASDCTQTINLSGISYPLTGASISAQPVCGTNVNLSPAMIQTLRGELVSIFVVSIFVLVALVVKAKVAPVVRSNVTSQKGLMIAKASSNELRAVVESRWDAQQGSGDIHPAKHFAASSWKYRVRVLHAMMKKRKSRISRAVFLKKLWSSLVLLILSFGSTVLLLALLPSSLPFNTVIDESSRSAVSWTGNVVSFFSPLYTELPLASGVWLDLVPLADVLVEFVLVLIATILGLHWQPVPNEREQKRMEQIGACEEACLVILVSAGTCLKTKGRDRLVSAVECGLKDLKLGCVFVVDMGGFNNAPLDDTWKIVSSIDPALVHYVYLPDSNRQLGQHWLSQIWIPFLHKNGRISRLFKQMLVLDFDAVVHPVSGGPPLSVGSLNKLLMVADGNIDDRCGTHVVLPLKSDLPDSTGDWESMRLNSEFYNRMMQVALSGGLLMSTGDSSESLCIKDRRFVEDNHFSSNPVHQALHAAQRRGRIIFSAQSCIEPIPCQNTIYELYCRYASEVPTALSQLKELLLAPSSFAHAPSIVLKFFILSGPVLNLFIMLLKPFVLGSLVFRDPLCLLCVAASFWIITTATTALYSFNLWRSSRKSAAFSSTIISYPAFLLYLGCMRLGLSVSGASFGTLADERVRPSIEASLKELYPCLPHYHVDWFTCWKTSDASRLSVLTSAAPSRLRSHSSDSMV